MISWFTFSSKQQNVMVTCVCQPPFSWLSLCVGGGGGSGCRPYIRKADKSRKPCKDQDLGGCWATLTSYIPSGEVLEDGEGAFPDTRSNPQRRAILCDSWPETASRDVGSMVADNIVW